MKYDVIIPVGPKDITFVPRVVSLLDRNLQDVDKIYIITNIKYFNILKCRLPFNINVYILDENQLIPDLNYAKLKIMLESRQQGLPVGWFFQQFLKYAFALSSYSNKYYLTWDADTLLLRKTVFFDKEKPLFTRKYEYNEEYFNTIYRLLEIKKNSRHFAKRQYTWFNNQMNVHWYDMSLPNISEQILKDIDTWRNVSCGMNE